MRDKYTVYIKVSLKKMRIKKPSFFEKKEGHKYFQGFLFLI